MLLCRTSTAGQTYCRCTARSYKLTQISRDCRLDLTVSCRLLHLPSVTNAAADTTAPPCVAAGCTEDAAPACTLPFSTSDLSSFSFSALQCASTCCADISSGRGKLQRAAGPLIALAAASYARAASSAVSKVPSHLRETNRQKAAGMSGIQDSAVLTLLTHDCCTPAAEQPNSR